MATKTTKTTKATQPAKAAKPAAPVPVPKPAEPATAPALRTKKPVAAKPPATPRVTFRLARPGATTVALAGTFNHWSASANALTASPEGVWSAELTLAPGTYEYRFVVDGEWIHDPTASESVPNPFGGVNSVLRVTA